MLKAVPDSLQKGLRLFCKGDELFVPALKFAERCAYHRKATQAVFINFHWRAGVIGIDQLKRQDADISMLHKARNLIVGARSQSGDIVDAVRNPLGTSGAYNHIVQIGTLFCRLEQQAQVETVIQASYIEN